MSVNDLRPYPAYRESGADWLGRVPIHWKILPNRAVFREVRERGHPAAIMLSVTIKHGVIEQRALLSASNKKDSSNLDRSAYKLVCPGDIVYNKMRAWQGAIAASRHCGIVSPAYVVQRPNDGIDSRYLHHLLRIPAFAAEAERWSYGITSDMWSLRPEHFRLIRGCFPPLAEQRAIVRSLDAADRRIRRYIRAKERLIELLDERKRALIHEAVTGRIDVRTGQPYPVYKDSGVEWLGKVPEHWEVAGLGYRYEQCLGKMLDGKRITGEHLVPYLRNADVQWDEINVADLPRMDIHPDEIPRYTVQPGDLLVCEGGEVGRCAIWKGEIDRCGFQKALHRLRPRDDERDRPKFLYYALSVAVTCGAFADGHESTIAHLTGEKLRRHRFAFPCADEQAAIVGFLDHAVRRIRAAISATQRQIEHVHEYRTRLIADVVTGKLDVREAAARLPETDPLAGNRDRADAIPTESNLHSTESHMAKEAIP